MLYDETDHAAAAAMRTSIVARAERSDAARRKQTTGRTDDGLPVHSFKSLLADLATYFRIQATTALNEKYVFTLRSHQANPDPAARLLSNLFLHYTFDLWMKRTHPDLPWCRYADDGLVHCRTEQEAEALRAELRARLEECRLEMHPTKTKIVYCKDGKRKGTYPNVTFDFLGYQFRPRMVRSSRNGQLFCSFTPAVSPSSLKAIRSTVRDLNIPQLTVRSLDDIARMLNPLLRGWIQYYGRYNPAALEIMLRYVNLTVLRWVMRKFKRFQGRKVGAANFLEKLVRIQPSLFEHWRIRMIGAFA